VCEAGRLYIGGSDGMVHGYDIGRGPERGVSRRWPPCPLGDEIIGLAAADGMVYAAAGYRVVEIDGGTGHPQRELLTMKCLVGAAPVISDGFAYVVGLGGIVNCVAVRLSVRRGCLQLTITSIIVIHFQPLVPDLCAE
jgi:hypothetical protein